MRLIEIQDGVLIDADKIEAVRAPDEKSPQCIVFTHHRKYQSTYPYETLIAILREGEVMGREVGGKEQIKEVIDKLNKVLPGMEHFAG